MAIPQKILMDVPFSQGIDTKTDPLLVQQPMLIALQNAIFQKGGTLTKRNGYLPLSTSIMGGGTLTTGQALALFNQELLQITSAGELYAYVPSINQWVDRGAVTPCTITDSQIVRNTYTQANPDMDTANGVTVTVWEDTRGGIRASVRDETTGGYILSDVSLSVNATNPKVVAVGTTLCVLCMDLTFGGLCLFTLNTASPTAFSSEVLVDTNVQSGALRLDAVSYNGQAILAAWSTSGAGTKISYILTNGTEGSPVNGGYPNPMLLTNSCANCVSLSWDSANGVIWLDMASFFGLYVQTLSTAFVSLTGPTLVDASTGIQNVIHHVSGTNLLLWYEVSSTQTYNHLVYSNQISLTGVVAGATVFMRSVGLASKAFHNASASTFVPFFHVAYSSSTQASLFMVNGLTGAVVAKGIPGLGGNLFTEGQLPRVVLTSGGTYAVPVCTRVQVTNSTTSVNGTITSINTYFIIGLDRYDYRFNSIDCYRSAQLGGNLHLCGGLVQIYDGQSVVEHGFHLYPDQVTATANTSGGSMSDGVYGVCVVWYWQDMQGQIHRSAPSQAQNVTISGGGGNGSISLTIPTLRITAKTGTRTPPVAAVFRTTVNGTNYQRVGNGSNDPVLSPVYSSTSIDTVSFSLTVNDAAIAANEFLYTTGNVLPNTPTPPAKLISSTKNRLVLAGVLGQPNTFYYSQPWISGNPVGFHPNLSGQVDPHGGPLTAVGTIDSTVMLFKEGSVFYFSGDGPDTTGNNNQFTEPQLVTSEVGCTNPDSIAITGDGVMCETAKGIWLIDRSLQSTYIGAPVEAYNSLQTTSAVQVDGVNQVRFTANDGVGLIYDTYFNQWGTFTNFQANDAVSWPYYTVEQQQVVFKYTYLSTNGTVMVEAPGYYLDNLNPIALYVQTAWIKTSSLQGFFKVPWVTILGIFYSNHTLNVGVAYDFQGFVNEIHQYPPNLGTETYGTNTYGVETPYGGVSSTVYQFRFRPNIMKTQSIQFTFTEQSPSNGQGFALSGATLQIAQLPGPFKKLSAAATIASS